MGYIGKRLKVVLWDILVKNGIYLEKIWDIFCKNYGIY